MKRIKAGVDLMDKIYGLACLRKADGTSYMYPDYMFTLINETFQNIIELDRKFIMGRTISNIIRLMPNMDKDIYELFTRILLKGIYSISGSVFLFGSWYNITVTPAGENYFIIKLNGLVHIKAAHA